MLTDSVLAKAIVKKSAEPEVINVHFVPHSHLDAGWLQTYD